ncbi:unnamed protein product [Boreogadus saida]
MERVTQVQDSELKIAASARFLGTTTRQLELLAAPTARALPNGRTRAGTLRAPPGQGEHSARSRHVPPIVAFLQEPYGTACFLGRPPTHPLWQTLSIPRACSPISAKDSTQRARGQPHASTLASVRAKSTQQQQQQQQQH